VTGSTASIVSTVVVAALARRRTGALSSGANATSHWLWGERAKRRHAPSARYTAVGYAIHHASSLLWAGVFDRATRAAHTPARIAATAAAVASAAYAVDYHVVPRRLTPGFDRHLSAPGMVATYAAFAVGLAAAHWLLHGKGRSAPGR